MRHNIYIRQEDEKIWEGIEDKPLFLHNALQSADKIIKNEAPEAVIKKALDIKETNDWHCKHGYVGKLCRSESCMIEARKHERSS